MAGSSEAGARRAAARAWRVAGNRMAAVTAAETPAPVPTLILASASPGRLAVLRNAGFDPIVEVSSVAEAELPGESTQDHCLRLATLKAEAVAARHQGGVVIGCDSVLDLDGAALGKPASPEEARQRWKAMAGRSGTLLTGHCVIDATSGRRAGGVAATTVRFGRPDDEELDAYIASGEPMRVAGAFTIDSLGGPFIDGLDGDSHNVIGLSLPLLRRLLAQLGLRITDFWVRATSGQP